MRRLIICALAAIAFITASAAEKIKVACIGNSITYGYLLPDREQNAYPFRLAGLLGDRYEVGNFGYSGATLLRKGHRPYHLLSEFRQALDFRPDIAVIHLGVNDTDPRDWPHYNSEFAGDYMAI
ncbi:MAG: sialate O-acetylesterase, partial [Muribaculaceae bacterium]|nr:sialate O-acetylesterase [Muribaculaceae bacterium]